MSNVLKVRGTGMDPLSVTACSQAVADIPMRETKGMPLVKSCRGHMSTPQCSGGQDWRAAENFFVKAWHFHPSSMIALWSSGEMLSM